MSKKGWILIIILVVLAFISMGRYNSMVDKEEEVKNAWAKVETQYQRRADLIPNLVNVVKGYAAHEKETLEAVMKARAEATSVKIDPTNLTAQNLQQFQAAQGQLSSALSRLMVVVERYPDLKANQNFLELQAQLEGTENRIAVARDRFNNAVMEYNKLIRRFPGNLFAGIFGFEKLTPFEANEGSEKAPEVNF
ncbi:MAG TPA: LemA family protein [Flammeovirgaceae bacterium]|nr:LemA family protein [Flammeovirgaceae bacterium]